MTEMRQRTMSVRALRRLSATELTGVKIALSTVLKTEHDLVPLLGAMKQAALAEYRVRSSRGLPLPGPYQRAYMATREVIHHLGTAREETELVVKTGRVAKGD